MGPFLKNDLTVFLKRFDDLTRFFMTLVGRFSAQIQRFVVVLFAPYPLIVEKSEIVKPLFESAIGRT